ncbi:MAG: hypothetical protein FWC34_03815 [Bacteroidetes bacterium]|nr:hypothetical protein [Bacteroidota bacterium]MCL2303434.1 hypothetical protein [Lentimicrobiaceae bacterium]
MNENEKNLFYRVLNDKITDESPLELTSNIMHIIHKKARKRAVTYKILGVLGYSLLGIFAIGFVGIYLFFYTDFKLPVLKIGFEMPSKIYPIIIFIIFIFSLVDLYFRKRLYENG